MFDAGRASCYLFIYTFSLIKLTLEHSLWHCVLYYQASINWNPYYLHRLHLLTCTDWYPLIHLKLSIKLTF
jgi:hypothetical protein